MQVAKAAVRLGDTRIHVKQFVFRVFKMYLRDHLLWCHRHGHVITWRKMIGQLATNNILLHGHFSGCLAPILPDGGAPSGLGMSGDRKGGMEEKGRAVIICKITHDTNLHLYYFSTGNSTINNYYLGLGHGLWQNCSQYFDYPSRKCQNGDRNVLWQTLLMTTCLNIAAHLTHFLREKNGKKTTTTTKNHSTAN